MTRQDANGQPYLAYYRTEESLAFSWTGDYSQPVEVAHGGAGEPVVAHFTITDVDLHTRIYVTGLTNNRVNTIQEVTAAYAEICDTWTRTVWGCDELDSELELPEWMIHMTETKPTGTNRGGYDVICRCGWQDTRTFTRRDDARKAGDAHLAKANAPQAQSYRRRHLRSPRVI